MRNFIQMFKVVQVMIFCFFLSIGSTIARKQAPPTITSFSPTSGPVGTLVTITGTNLDNPTALTIGSVSTILVSKTATKIVGMVMPGTTSGNITITTVFGSVSSSNNFTQTPNTGNLFNQNGNKLVGTGAIATHIFNTKSDSAYASQGYSVSVSADGNTAIVGGNSDNGGKGAAWIFTRNGNTWSQQGSKLVGTGAVGSSSQGISVSISADGNTAIVGGYLDNEGRGAAWIFTRNGNTWSQQGSKLVGTGALGNAYQGSSVSISADGNTVIVGGVGDGLDDLELRDFVDKGASWIFVRNGNTWSQQGSKLVGTGAVGSPQQGMSVCLSADGNTAIVGGNGDNRGTGAAWIFTRNGDTWSQQGNKLVGTDFIRGDYASLQGQSVSISADGNTAIVGGKGDNNLIGAAWVYTRTGNNWTQQGNKLVGKDAIGRSSQGCSVSISADGKTVAIGGCSDNESFGATWIFTRTGNDWTQLGKKLEFQGNVGRSAQGISVSLSSDGKTIFTGCPGDNNGKGAVCSFDLVNSPLNRSITSFTSISGTVGPVGTLVTINGTGLSDSCSITIGNVPAIVISKSATKLVAMVMPGAVDWIISLSNASGVTNSASKFTVTPTPYPNIQQSDKLVSRDAYGGLQGSAVAISAEGNTVLVGLPIESMSKGTAVVYVGAGNGWSQQGNKLTVTGAAGSMQSLGTSVSISADGNTAILGAPDDDNGIGAAWIFTRTAGVWSQQGTKLIGSGAVGNTRQGSSVAISADGNTVAISGIFDNRQKGAIWVFTRTANTWTQTGNKLVGTVSSGLPQIGTSLAISADGKTIIAGGQFDFASKGASWIFTKTGNTWAQQGAKLVGTGTTGSNYAGQGSAVALSADGNTAIVGSKYDNAGIGAAWIFTRSNGVWTQQGNKLTGKNCIGKANFGNAVAITADGNTAIVGGWNDNANGTVYASGKGANWVYTRSGSVWTQQGSKLIGTGNSGNATQGYSVAISANGNTTISGAPMDQIGVGAIWLYEYIPESRGPDWEYQNNYKSGSTDLNFIDTTKSIISILQKEQAISLQSMEMGIYPNPSNGRFTVSFTSKMATTLNLTIVEAGTGKTMYAQPVNATKGNNQVPITMQKKQGLSTYIVHLEGVGVKYESKKLLIQ